MSGNAILKYRGHAKVTEKVALCLAFMDQKIQSILQVLCKYKIVQKNLFKWTELNSVRFYVIRKISNCQ